MMLSYSYSDTYKKSVVETRIIKSLCPESNHDLMTQHDNPSDVKEQGEGINYSISLQVSRHDYLKFYLRNNPNNIFKRIKNLQNQYIQNFYKQNKDLCLTINIVSAPKISNGRYEYQAKLRVYCYYAKQRVHKLLFPEQNVQKWGNFEFV